MGKRKASEMTSEAKRLLELAIKTKTESFGIDPLNGKYYYTSLSNKDGMDHIETDKSYNLALFISECSPKKITAICAAYLEAIELLKEVAEKREQDLKYIPEYLHGEFVNKAKSFLQELEGRTIQETKCE